MKKLIHNTQHAVDKVETTENIISDRAGINAYVRYIKHIGIIPLLSYFFKMIRKNRKGAKIEELFMQILCAHTSSDGRNINYFNTLAKDPAYAAAIETSQDRLVSSHTVKRFFYAFKPCMEILFRAVLKRLFVWRLKIALPKCIILNLDVMLMDNTDAIMREGVEQTYKKKVKGYAPILMTWKRFIIDGIFRSGKKHSNHEDDAIKMIRRMVDTIRKKFDPNVPIVIRMDSGYFDQKIFQALEDLNVGYIVGGVFFPQVKSFINRIPAENYKPHFGKKDEDIWEYYEFGDCRGTWNKFRRAIFFRSIIEEKRYLLPGTRPGTIVYTNLGMGQDIDSQLKKAGYEYLLLPEEVVRSYQQRGADELVHKTLKDFSNQRLPFQGFVPNSAVFHTTLIAFLLFESFKEDVGVPVIPVSSSPTTFRRKLLDIAGHFIKTGRKIILKVTPTTMKELNFKQLWERCVNAPPIPAWVY